MERNQHYIEDCYFAVDRSTRQTLSAFHREHRARICHHNGFEWQYVILGKGGPTALFLPGAAGTYAIWWQQALALAGDLQIISISYPSVGTLEGLRAGMNALLDLEGVDRFHVIGSSMGGYLAQYLAAAQPDRLLSATFGNTLAPTKPFLRSAPLLRLAIRIFPLKSIHAIYRWFTQTRLVPAGGDSPLLSAYLHERSLIGFSKADALARINCVSQRFPPVDLMGRDLPILIIDSENDPLIHQSVRLAVRGLYPSAQRCTFWRAGHFAYLTQPQAYTQVLRAFLLHSGISNQSRVLLVRG